MIMSGFGRGYFRKLDELSGSISATDGKGGEIDFDRAIEKACSIMEKAGGAGKKIMFIGNGGSAAISSHMAIDFWKNGGMKSTAFNDSSFLTCLGNDFGYEHVFEKPIEMFSEKGDALVAISSSGRSENILLGVRAAKANGCGIITLSGFMKDNPLRLEGDVNFYVPSSAYGPVEVIHQSLCHCMLDAIMVKQGKLKSEHLIRAVEPPEKNKKGRKV